MHHDVLLFDAEQHFNGILLDAPDHLLEHIEAFPLVFNNRILLPVCPKAYAILELVHGIDMVHPLLVHNPQEHPAFQLPNNLFAELGFLLIIDLMGLLPDFFLQITGCNGFKIYFFQIQIAFGNQDVLSMGDHRRKIPVIGRRLIAAIRIYNPVGHCIDHIQYVVLQVFAVQDLVALAINDLALLVHDIVILKDRLSSLKVYALNPLLGALDSVGQHPGLDRLVLLQAQHIYHPQHPIGAKEAHQVILQRNIEPGFAGIPLTP